ncbi:hypothetical protein Bca52824_074802 [Brassica carinata]|uniref:tRNA-binding domain-containing protein n=1 Tax=Brassica carinata TaxID=52824 RepID=A0A8X7PQW0_BRACI|nr:hypothetical protein Bca52824_074802 [Brassica carinata]
MPSFSREVFKQLNLPLQFSLSDEGGEVLLASRPWEILPRNHKIGTPQPLFKELTDEEVQQYKDKFAGNQADRRARDAEAANMAADQLKKTKLSSSIRCAATSKTQPAADRELTLARLDIRVGKILKAEKHPNADSLYVEEIDVGGAETRTIVSGLVKYIPLEEMQNRMVCVLCNLKPAKMRDVMSQGMVLAASSSDGSKVELVEPPESAEIGERVRFQGFEGEPDVVLNPTKKVWETLVVDLHTDENLVACYKDLPFTTDAGVCKDNFFSVISVTGNGDVFLDAQYTREGEMEDERVDLVLGGSGTTDEENSSVKVAGKGKRKFLDEGAETRKKKYANGEYGEGVYREDGKDGD